MRRPDYVLKALNKVTDERRRIGAAWKNENGAISIVLDPFITLNGNDKDIILTLFNFDFNKRE